MLIFFVSGNIWLTYHISQQNPLLYVPNLRKLTLILRESSVGNFKINLLPAFSSEEFNGRTLHITLMLHSSGGGPGGCWVVMFPCSSIQLMFWHNNMQNIHTMLNFSWAKIENLLGCNVDKDGYSAISEEYFDGTGIIVLWQCS